MSRCPRVGRLRAIGRCSGNLSGSSRHLRELRRCDHPLRAQFRLVGLPFCPSSEYQVANLQRDRTSLVAVAVPFASHPTHFEACNRIGFASAATA
jgi:hypothetical protein